MLIFLFLLLVEPLVELRRNLLKMGRLMDELRLRLYLRKRLRLSLVLMMVEARNVLQVIVSGGCLCVVQAGQVWFCVRQTFCLHVGVVVDRLNLRWMLFVLFLLNLLLLVTILLD